MNGALTPQADLIHESGGLGVGFLDPLHDAGWVGGVFEFDGNGTIDIEFFDGLQIRSEFHDATSRWKIAMDHAIAITNVDVNGLAGQF